MAKRKGNGKRGGRGGDPGGGGGGGRGRGGGGGRGRGRGIQGSYLMDEALDFNIQMYANAHLEYPQTPPRSSGRGRTRNLLEQNSERNTPNRGRGRGFRGRGRGGHHPEFSYNRRHSDLGIGASPKDRGRGGRTNKLRPGAPLTGLLYQDRPLLRPIVFVRSTLNPILFDQDEEDLLKPGVEEVDDTEQGHVPTADRVSRVFSGGNIQPMESSSEADNDDTNDEEEEEIEVVDFNDIGKLFEPPTTKSKKISPKKPSRKIVETQFIGSSIYNNHSIPLHQPQAGLTDMDTLTKIMDENLSATERSLEDDSHRGPAAAEQSLFYTDIQPTPIPVEMAPTSNPFPSEEFDDDIIVYVAPHPRKGVQTSPEKPPPTNGVPDTSEFTPYIRDASLSLAVASSSSTTEPQPTTQPQPENKTQIPSLSSFSFSFPTPEGKTRGRLRIPPVTIPRLAISWKRKKDILSKKGRKPSFRIFGAMHEEAQLRDPREKERRRGDSDLDWGDTDDDRDDDRESDHDHTVDRMDDVERPSELVNGNGNGNVSGKDKGKCKAREVEDEHGMEVDTDMDLNAMHQFVGGLLGENAGQHVTMDDLRDEEQMKLEEEEQDTGDDSMVLSESEGNSSDDEDAEVERIVANEEAMLISETLEFEDGKDEDKEEDDISEDEEDENQTPRTSFQNRLERLRNQASSSKHDHEDDDDYEDYDEMLKRNMSFDEMDSSTQLFFNDLVMSDMEFQDFNHKRRKQPNGLPENLKAQWEKDRQKKAAYKKARDQARLENAADPLSQKKGGKKGRKAMLAAASADPTIIVIPNRIIDMSTLVQQIKRFIDDKDGRLTMSLPPTNKATRKSIHELAVAFNLKSVSKGAGLARYTTLTKTSRTGGLGVDESKVARIVRGMGARGDSFVHDRKVKGKGKKKERSGGGGGGAQAHLPRHRDGDEVGKAAPKLSSNNLGFRMLSMMGWSEGERIGATGGLQDPLTAIIKNTKLGLGASK